MSSSIKCVKLSTKCTGVHGCQLQPYHISPKNSLPIILSSIFCFPKTSRGHNFAEILDKAHSHIFLVITAVSTHFQYYMVAAVRLSHDDGSYLTSTIQPPSDCIAVLRDLPRPADAKGLLHFLEFINFYRSFLPHAAEK